jgi:UDP-glucose 4-epimerase
VRALVTGGAGFLGSVLVDRLLAEGHAVDVIDDLSTGRLDNLGEARADRRNQLSIHHFDIREAQVVDLVARRQPEIVFHLAARPGADAVTDAEVSVLGTLRILDGALAAGARKIVFASSAAIYGEAEKTPIRESHAQRPISAHGVAKKAATDYLAAYRDLHGLEFTALALGAVYGPRQRHGAVAAFTGGGSIVRGDGKQTRDFVFVDDAVDAFVRAAERGSGLVVNIGTGRETSVLELLRLVSTADPVFEDAAAGDRRRSVLDAGRARIHLGWSAWTSLEDGLRQTLG